MFRYSVRYSVFRAPRALLSEQYEHLKTGDVVFFTASANTPITSVILNSFFSHVGVVLREKGHLFISEAQPGVELMEHGQGELRMTFGATVVPLLLRLANYTGVYYIMALDRLLDGDDEEALKAEADRLGREEHPYPTMLQTALSAMKIPCRARHCFQHAAYLLDVAKLRAGDEPLASAPTLEVGARLMALPGQPLLNGRRRYLPPYQIVYDF